MKIFLPCALLLVTLATAKSGFDQYPVLAIAEIVKNSAPKDDNEYLKNPGDVFIDAKGTPARSHVVYLGQSRPISAETQHFLDEYFGKARKKPEWVGLFQREILCREEDRKYWLPIQKQLGPAFESEVTSGASVELFLTFLGAYRASNGELVKVLTINDFLARGR